MATQKTKTSKEKKIKVADIIFQSSPVKIKKEDKVKEEKKEISRGLKKGYEVDEPAKGKVSGEAERVQATLVLRGVEPLKKEEISPLAEEGYDEIVQRETIPLAKPDAPIAKQIVDFEKREIERFSKEEAKKPVWSQKRSFKKYAVLLIILVFLGGTAYAAFVVLPKATIQIVTKKSRWQYADAVVATKKVANVDSINRLIPAEIFTQRKNFTYSFSATGKKQMSHKATGVITIFNSYSSRPQRLVKNTRFVAPNGKVFRLVQNVVVPGAAILQGKFVSASIDAPVVADAAGADYNIGPVSKFTIAGFAGTPKYNGFYASSSLAMAGGIIGLAGYPTADDIKRHEPDAIKSLKDNIDSFLYSGISPSFKVIDGSEQFNILKETISDIADKDGNFSIFIDAQSSVVVFKESDMVELMRDLANKTLNPNGDQSHNFDIKDYKIDYGTGRPDLYQGQMSFAPTFSGTFWQSISADSFKQRALSKNESELKSLVDSLANVQKATVSFWPFWVKSVPGDPNRVKVEVE